MKRNRDRAFDAIPSDVCRFSLQEIAVALVKLVDVHEGLWQLQVAFGQTAANLNINGRLTPAAITQVLGLQLGRVKTADALTVDAAFVNPATRIIVPTVVN